MSYQVLARKWRPRSFDELAGQEHVQRALINALENNRLHHAFLFTGTRGVGKTTIARILAKSLNCDQGISAHPCNECASCREINQGRFVDLIEVDAASRTKVEDTRELLENVQYAPTRGRYKVYLIDEVHMLSTHSFNALLKTLEEPPPHVKFLLATTDPQRLPVTILSRCLQFNLKRLSPEIITQQLKKIIESEAIPTEEPALGLLARAADGSMRDALSLLDQAIAFGNGELKLQEVRDMLGTLDQDFVYRLLNIIASHDTLSVTAIVDEIAALSVDFTNVLDTLLHLLHRIALTQMEPKSIASYDGDQEQLKTMASTISVEDVQLYYQIALLTKRDIYLAPDARTGFEMGLLRMLAFKPAQSSHQAPPSSSTTSSAPPSTLSKSDSLQSIKDSLKKNPEETPRMQQTASTTLKTAHAKPSDSQVKTLPTDKHDWDALVKQLDISGIAQQLAANCAFEQLEQNTIHLKLYVSHKQLLNDQRKQQLRDAIGKYLKQDVGINIQVEQQVDDTPAQLKQQRDQQRQQAAVDEIHNDAAVRSMLETFDAKINEDSIRPINEVN